MSEIVLERRAIPTFEGLYEMREDGVVFSLPREVVMSNGVIRYVNGRQLKAIGGKNRHGNKIESLNKVGLCNSGKRSNIAINALMQIVFPDKFLPVKDLDGEVWKALEGFDEYAISNLGRIKKLRKNRKTANIQYVSQEHIVKPYVSSMNNNTTFLHAVHLRVNGNDYENRLLSRLVANAFVAPVSESCEVFHIDGNNLNDVASNLKVLPTGENKSLIALRKFKEKTGFQKFKTDESGVQMQFCTECKCYLPITTEHWTMLRNGSANSKCKPCRSKTQSEWEKNKKLKELKENCK